VKGISANVTAQDLSQLEYVRFHIQQDAARLRFVDWILRQAVRAIRLRAFAQLNQGVVVTHNQENSNQKYKNRKPFFEAGGRRAM
jgi:hypothetical protein